LVGKPEGKRPIGRPRRGWEESTRMDIKGIERCGMDQDQDQVQDRAQ
jgi:hypothetical protein